MRKPDLPQPLLGFYLRWRMVSRVAGALAAMLVIWDKASADWPPDGIALCAACDARGVLIASDGTGGAFVTWTDARNGPDGRNDDVFLQRVTASGAIAPGWPADGLAVCVVAGIQVAEQITPDGFGGAIVAWRDYRNAIPGGTASDIYAQRVLANGTIAPAWAVDGAPVARTVNDQELPVGVGDGNGGAFFTWEEGYAADPNINVQYLAADGSVMPGWPVNGLPVCTAPGFQGFPQLVSDGAGGVIVAWGDLRDGLVASYAQRVTAAAAVAAGWPTNGRRVMLGPYTQQLVPDGVGGAFLAGGTAAPLYFYDYYLQRFAGTGVTAPGWPDGGAVVCQAPDERVGLRMEPDGAGGVLLVWSDYRDHNDDDIYALRMRSDGTRDPNWPANGLAVTNNTALDDYTDLAPDGEGGAYLCWDQYTNATGDHVLIQHLTGAGSVASNWSATGLVVPSNVSNAVPHIVADGVGGAIVTWCDVNGHTRALRVTQDVPVATELSTASAVFESGAVRLRWYASDAASLLATVERSTQTTDWEALARVTADGTGWLTYEDRAVTPGTRYGYRLAYRPGGELRHTDEAWVEVPAYHPTFQFALQGLTPNPSPGDPVVSFSLSTSEPATVDVFDPHGRLVLSREVGTLGPGTHTLKLGEGGRLPAGIYAVRLRQGEKIATVRAVVIR